MAKEIFIPKHGKNKWSIGFRDQVIPVPKEGQVLIAQVVFGINFADVMARQGL